MELLVQQLPLIALAMMRPLGMLLLLPLFTGKSLGGTLLHNALVLLLALPVLPLIQNQAQWLHDASNWAMLHLYGREFFIGLLLGFCAAIPFWAIDMAGFVIDTMRGASMSTILNPLMAIESSLYGMLFSQVLTVLFLVSGGFNNLLEALYASYQQLTPGAELDFSQAFFSFMKTEWQMMFELCLNFALPAIVVMLLIDIAMGLVNRSAQQLNVFFLSMPIKSLLVMLLLLFSLGFALHHYITLMLGFKRHLGILLGTLVHV